MKPQVQHRAPVVWLTGLSGAGKTTLCRASEKVLRDQGFDVIVLDGDQLRSGLCSDLGFSEADRREQARRVSWLASMFASRGTIVLIAVMAPFESARRVARVILPDVKFVFVKASVEECERRDVKGLYKLARGGGLADLIGISATFEVPIDAALICPTETAPIDECVKEIVRLTKCCE